MKKVFFFAATLAAMASCSTEGLVDDWFGNGKDGAISFVMGQKNMTRSYQDMQKTGHYNFGVFAYKSTDEVTPVMPNYLVGYYDDNLAYQKSGTTVGDEGGVADGLSYWMYEGMGNTEYTGTYAGAAITDAYKSNNPNQFLKFWDNAASNTAFYAYAPYINGTGTVTYVDGVPQTDKTGNDVKVMCFPNGTLKAAMVEDGDPVDQSEYMYAYNNVAKTNYGHDVALNFKRLNAKVNIKFWEDVNGYDVRILDLSSSYKGVQAAASIKNPNFPLAAPIGDAYDGLTFGNYGYAGGKFYSENGVKISFASSPEAIKQFKGTEQTNTTPLVFTSPTEAKIGETRFTAAQSPSTYYAIPKGQGETLLENTTTDFADAATTEDAKYGVTGFTFHVTYELTAKDTGERIVVNNATVHVPYEYCNWKANTHYTYIFKITTNSNGTTEDTPTIDPKDPEVPTVQALYPIVFDNCTVEDWTENESEWVITDGTELTYHNITLKESSVEKYSYNAANHTISVSVADLDKHANHTIAYNAYDATAAANGGIQVTAPDGSDVTASMYTAGTGTGSIALTSAAAAGVYTVTYYCPDTDINKNHPRTWTQTFFVGDEYQVSTHHNSIGTKFNEASASLTITTAKNSSDETNAGTSGDLYIEYPDNFKSTYFTTTQLATMKEAVQVAADKKTVIVKNNAEPGVYKLVYKINEGGKEVKVAASKFEVVDYTLSLSPTKVYNHGTAMTVTGNQAASTDNTYTTTVGTVSGKDITVPATTADNTTGTVTYTVWNGASDVAKTTYTADFTVYNTHSVSVTKTSISRSKETTTATSYSTDVTAIKPVINGAATTSSVLSKLSVKVKDATGAYVAVSNADFFKITETSVGEYKLEVRRDAPAGNYYVEFVSTVGGADKAEYVHFVVTE